MLKKMLIEKRKRQRDSKRKAGTEIVTQRHTEKDRKYKTETTR